MLTGLDHAVLVVPDLAEAVGRYKALGFEVAPGGRHSTGTENALIGFEHSGYLELLAFQNPAPNHRWAPMLAYGGGLVDICVSSDASAEDCAAYLGAGVQMNPSMEMSRTKPDGTKVTWKLSIPVAPFAGAMPFLIEDLTPVALRIPPAGGHANGAVRIAGVRYACVDKKAVADQYQTILRKQPQPLQAPELQAAGVRFSVGEFNLDFLQPASPGSPIAEHLERHGPGPHSLVLEVAKGRSATRWRGPETVNVWIDTVPQM